MAVRLATAIGVLALVGGCASPEELRLRDEAVCTGYGFHPGTDDFAACLQRESLARRYAASPSAPYWPYWDPPWRPWL